MELVRAVGGISWIVGLITLFVQPVLGVLIGRDEADVLHALLRHSVNLLVITWNPGEEIERRMGEWSVRPIDILVAA